MPQLIIRNAGGAWEALIANTNQALAFEGATLAEQVGYVQLLAQSMQAGWGSVVENVLKCFKGVPGGAEAGDVAEGLFATADSLVLEEEVIFTAAEDGVLMDSIAAAGADLIAALAAL